MSVEKVFLDLKLQWFMSFTLLQFGFSTSTHYLALSCFLTLFTCFLKDEIISSIFLWPLVLPGLFLLLRTTYIPFYLHSSFMCVSF